METVEEKTPAYFFKGLESKDTCPGKFNNYYPFGGTLAGTSYQRLGALTNKYRYQGQEGRRIWILTGIILNGECMIRLSAGLW